LKIIYLKSKLTNEKYQNNKRIVKIVRCLAECLKENGYKFEPQEIYKRFEKERKLCTPTEYASDYFSYLLRDNDESIFFR